MTKDLIEHHTHYKEIDGYDETIFITRKEHRELHQKLRWEGKCNIPPGELRDISKKAHQRTDKCKEYKRKWAQEHPEHNDNRNEQWYEDNREKMRKQQKAWRDKNREHVNEYARMRTAQKRLEKEVI